MSAVPIKVDCLKISSSFLLEIAVAYSQEIYVLLLSAYAYFLQRKYCLRECHHTEHTGDALPRL